jgi:hypothetical protein
MTDLLVTRGATFSRDGANRLILTRRWADGPQVCFIGLNPSTADHLVDDPTVRRWMHFGRAWGFGGIVAVNLYPFRSSSPDECRRWADWECNGQDWYARDDIHHNCSVVAQTAKLAKLTVACWVPLRGTSTGSKRSSRGSRPATSRGRTSIASARPQAARRFIRWRAAGTAFPITRSPSSGGPPEWPSSAKTWERPAGAG